MFFEYTILYKRRPVTILLYGYVIKVKYNFKTQEISTLHKITQQCLCSKYNLFKTNVFSHIFFYYYEINKQIKLIKHKDKF